MNQNKISASVRHRLRLRY